MNKYEKTLAQYVTELDDAAVQMAVEKIVRENYEKYNNVEVYKQLFNCIDLTTLRSEDHTESVARFTKRVNDFENEHGDMPNVAALCVYPNYAATVRMNLEVYSLCFGWFPLFANILRSESCRDDACRKRWCR